MRDYAVRYAGPEKRPGVGGLWYRRVESWKVPDLGHYREHSVWTWVCAAEVPLQKLTSDAKVS